LEGKELERNENIFSVYRSRKRRQVKRTDDSKGHVYTQSCGIHQECADAERGVGCLGREGKWRMAEKERKKKKKSKVV
jgi:hypothetical protein